MGSIFNGDRLAALIIALIYLVVALINFVEEMLRHFNWFGR